MLPGQTRLGASAETRPSPSWKANEERPQTGLPLPYTGGNGERVPTIGPHVFQVRAREWRGSTLIRDPIKPPRPPGGATVLSTSCYLTLPGALAYQRVTGCGRSLNANYMGFSLANTEEESFLFALLAFFPPIARPRRDQKRSARPSDLFCVMTAIPPRFIIEVPPLAISSSGLRQRRTDSASRPFRTPALTAA